MYKAVYNGTRMNELVMSLYLRRLAYQVQTLFFDFLEDFLELNSITLQEKETECIDFKYIMRKNPTGYTSDVSIAVGACRPLRIQCT